MLKIQLGSKIFQLDLDWRDKEDILTGDYFGVLDYLPRATFLKSFFESLSNLNPSVDLPLGGVEWPQVELEFWPKQAAGREDTEPDVVIVSNRWVVVMEVKLNSGLQPRQAVREFLVGRDIARERSLNPENVFFVLVSRAKLSLCDGFSAKDAEVHSELEAKALYLPWFRAYAIVDEWLRIGADGVALVPEHRRLLEDLLAAMRYRHALGFSHFTFPNQGCVPEAAGPFFLANKFAGFMNGTVLPQRPAVFFASKCFAGFGRHAPEVPGAWQRWCAEPWAGFQGKAPRVGPVATVFKRERFQGFLGRAERCKTFESGWVARRRRSDGNTTNDRRA